MSKIYEILVREAKALLEKVPKSLFQVSPLHPTPLQASSLKRKWNDDVTDAKSSEVNQLSEDLKEDKKEDHVKEDSRNKRQKVNENGDSVQVPQFDKSKQIDDSNGDSAGSKSSGGDSQQVIQTKLPRWAQPSKQSPGRPKLALLYGAPRIQVKEIKTKQEQNGISAEIVAEIKKVAELYENERKAKEELKRKMERLKALEIEKARIAKEKEKEREKEKEKEKERKEKEKEKEKDRKNNINWTNPQTLPIPPPNGTNPFQRPPPVPTSIVGPPTAPKARDIEVTRPTQTPPPPERPWEAFFGVVAQNQPPNLAAPTEVTNHSFNPFSNSPGLSHATWGAATNAPSGPGEAWPSATPLSQNIGNGNVSQTQKSPGPSQFGAGLIATKQAGNNLSVIATNPPFSNQPFPPPFPPSPSNSPFDNGTRSTVNPSPAAQFPTPFAPNKSTSHFKPPTGTKSPITIDFTVARMPTSSELQSYANPKAPAYAQEARKGAKGQ